MIDSGGVVMYRSRTGLAGCSLWESHVAPIRASVVGSPGVSANPIKFDGI